MSSETNENSWLGRPLTQEIPSSQGLSIGHMLALAYVQLGREVPADVVKSVLDMARSKFDREELQRTLDMMNKTAFEMPQMAEALGDLNLGTLLNTIILDQAKGPAASIKGEIIRNTAALVFPGVAIELRKKLGLF